MTNLDLTGRSSVDAPVDDHDIYLSVVVPAFNEVSRIHTTLWSIAEYLSGFPHRCEVIVVDDGSTDGTGEAVLSLSDLFDDLSVVGGGTNFGKGHAVRSGMSQARGQFRLFMDADNSTDLSQLNVLTAAADACLGGVPDVVVGSVAARRSEIERAQPKLRQFLGRSSNLLIRSMLVPGVRDTQRGFKLFTAEAAEAVFSRCVVDGWAFDVEVLAVASLLGFTTLEVPVVWDHCDDSKVTAVSYLESLLDVFRIKLRMIAGKYRVGSGTTPVLALGGKMRVLP